MSKDSVRHTYRKALRSLSRLIQLVAVLGVSLKSAGSAAINDNPGLSFLEVSPDPAWEPSINNRGEIVYVARDERGFLNVFSTLRGQLTQSETNNVLSPSINDSGELVHTDTGGPDNQAQVVSSVRGVLLTDAPATLPSLSDSGEVCYLQSSLSPPGIFTDKRGRVATLASGAGTRCDLNRWGEIVFLAEDSENQLEVFSSDKGQLTNLRETPHPIKSVAVNNNGEAIFAIANSIYLVPDKLIAHFEDLVGAPIDLNDAGDIVFPLVGPQGVRIVLGTRDPTRYPAFDPVDLGSSSPQSLEVSAVLEPESGSSWFDPQRRGTLTVAILSTQTSSGEEADVDATRIEPLSVTLGPARATIVVRSMSNLEDIDGDGDLDLMLYFRSHAIGVACGDTEIEIQGKMEDGSEVRGAVGISTPECP